MLKFSKNCLIKWIIWYNFHEYFYYRKSRLLANIIYSYKLQHHSSKNCYESAKLSRLLINRYSYIPSSLGVFFVFVYRRGLASPQSGFVESPRNRVVFFPPPLFVPLSLRFYKRASARAPVVIYKWPSPATSETETVERYRFGRPFHFRSG